MRGSGMDKSERLDLAVRAHLASVRADQAEERSALLDRKFAPVIKAIDQYMNLYGEDVGPADHFDVLMGLIAQNGGGGLSKEDVLTGMQSHEERGAANREAADALHEFNAAMGDHH